MYAHLHNTFPKLTKIAKIASGIECKGELYLGLKICVLHILNKAKNLGYINQAARGSWAGIACLLGARWPDC